LKTICDEITESCIKVLAEWNHLLEDKSAIKVNIQEPIFLQECLEGFSK
jgi:hypothetical protein